jgi:ribose/xylose/arabinose/galactoside ABC-type transport system permease subunit
MGSNIVMTSGQLDLSIGSAMTLGGMMAVGLEPRPTALGLAPAMAGAVRPVGRALHVGRRRGGDE